jgi:hypothetical protein
VLFPIFLLSFGVAIQSLVYPDDEFSLGRLSEVVYAPFFDMLGAMLTLNIVAGWMHFCSTKKYVNFFTFTQTGKSDEQCFVNRTVFDENSGQKRMCPQRNVFALFLFGVYMMLTNVLLLNLLIAMFRLVD